MKCVYCERQVPKECTGEIEDHCDWCGGPAKPGPDDEPHGSRWCSQKCFDEDSADQDFGWPKRST